MKSGVELIAEERIKQVEKDGWTSEHDAEHNSGELVDAAVSYCISSPDFEINIGNAYTDVKAKIAIWPWSIKAWKPSPKNRIRELVKAGALIAAEIDRLQNLNP